MTTPTAKMLIDLYRNNHNILHAQLKDITQAESLLQLPFRGNCLNWVTGHILAAREQCLGLLGLPGVMSAEEKKRYGHGSEPLVEANAATAMDLADLLSRLDETLPRLVEGLEGLSAEDLEREVAIWRGPLPLREAIGFVQWHEFYHTGQLELLRQLAGKDDHII